jgi:hypothetical protein
MNRHGAFVFLSPHEMNIGVRPRSFHRFEGLKSVSARHFSPAGTKWRAINKKGTPKDVRRSINKRIRPKSRCFVETFFNVSPSKTPGSLNETARYGMPANVACDGLAKRHQLVAHAASVY